MGMSNSNAATLEPHCDQSILGLTGFRKSYPSLQEKRFR